MNTVATIGLDLAKHVFHVHGTNKHGRAVLSRRLARRDVIRFFANLPPCLVGLEAGRAAHHWARELTKLGHQVRLMPPQYVKPYVKTNKNDAIDAEAICEAVRRPTMRFVPVKSLDQQAILALHRAREGLVPGSHGADQSDPRDSRRVRACGLQRHPFGREGGRGGGQQP